MLKKDEFWGVMDSGDILTEVTCVNVGDVDAPMLYKSKRAAHDAASNHDGDEVTVIKMKVSIVIDKKLTKND